jgi:hypothetical protein
MLFWGVYGFPFSPPCLGGKGEEDFNFGWVEEERKGFLEIAENC